MKIDKKTLEDLAIWDRQGGVLHLIDHCMTTGGSQYLKNALQQPPGTYTQLLATQDAVKQSMKLVDVWPEKLNNGMVLMVEKFFSATESIISRPTPFTVFIDKIVKKLVPKNEQALLRFSITQLIDFVKSCHTIIDKYSENKGSELISAILSEMSKILSSEYFVLLKNTPDEPGHKALLTSAYYARRHLKSGSHQLIQLIYQLDYFRSLAIATESNGWTLPDILPSGQTYQADQLKHPLLDQPVAYDISMDRGSNFIFITGANMSGKSTYMKSIGIGAFLAHIGCGVPAVKMTISYINALITNMQIEDNIYTGESYFLAEVLRIKNTALQIQQGKNNLVLMDELFKGTNIHDAYECTEAVVKALVNKPDNMYCLSTHLYELGDRLKTFDNIQFRYFETITAADGSYSFSYKIKNGVSDDKIGYWVLKKEGVIDILNNS